MLIGAAALAVVWKTLERVGRNWKNRGRVCAGARSPSWGRFLGVLEPVAKMACHLISSILRQWSLYIVSPLV